MILELGPRCLQRLMVDVSPLTSKSYSVKFFQYTNLKSNEPRTGYPLPIAPCSRRADHMLENPIVLSFTAMGAIGYVKNETLVQLPPASYRIISNNITCNVEIRLDPLVYT